MAMIEINWNPPHKTLKQFAGLWFPLFFGFVGLIVLRRTHSIGLASAIWLVAGALGLIGYLVPKLARPIFVGWMCAAYPIGWVVSHLVLVTIYYLAVTPLGLIMRLTGMDPMQRRFDRAAPTYWVKRRQDAGTDRYFRQF